MAGLCVEHEVSPSAEEPRLLKDFSSCVEVLERRWRRLSQCASIWKICASLAAFPPLRGPCVLCLFSLTHFHFLSSGGSEECVCQCGVASSRRGPGLPEPTPQTEGLDFHLEYLLAFDLQPLEATSA